MPVLEEKAEYKAHTPAPYFIVIPGNLHDGSQTISLNGESFTFLTGVPTCLSMRHFDALIAKNGGKEDGVLKVAYKNLAVAPTKPQMMALAKGEDPFAVPTVDSKKGVVEGIKEFVRGGKKKESG